jgi:hypothetical protein
MKTIPKHQAIPSEAVDEPNIPPSGMGAPPVSRGHHTENHLPEDDLTTERSVESGMEDAEEDSSDEAARSGTRSEG